MLISYITLVKVLEPWNCFWLVWYNIMPFFFFGTILWNDLRTLFFYQCPFVDPIVISPWSPAIWNSSLIILCLFCDLGTLEEYWPVILLSFPQFWSFWCLLMIGLRSYVFLAILLHIWCASQCPGSWCSWCCCALLLLSTPVWALL